MSVAYYIVLDNDDPDFDTFVNGKALAHEENLAALCKKLGLRTLDDFVVMSDDDISDWLGEDIDRPTGEEDRWFTADEGLEFVATLSSHINAHPQAVKDAAGCLEDLAEYTDVIEKARLIGAKWRLNLDF
ncbi:MAG TPA: hypothetical protein DCS21_05925 [Gammaproteobacteria bacterium]|nr:hypothetical protein [Gammaproteobacteria bacterium]